MIKSPSNSGESKNGSDNADAAAAARRRIEEEMAKIQEISKQARQTKMRSLVGEEAATATERKSEIRQKQEQYTRLGREHLLDEHGNPLPIEKASSPIKTGPDSPIKAYQAVVEKNALTSTIQSPSLYNHDPVTSHSMAETSKSSTEAIDHKIPATWHSGPFYTLIEIRQRMVDINDTKNREQYLSPDEFQKAFNMSKMEFHNLPKWKKDKLKQQLYLF